MVWEYPTLCQDAIEEWQDGGFWVQVCVALRQCVTALTGRAARLASGTDWLGTCSGAWATLAWRNGTGLSTAETLDSVGEVVKGRCNGEKPQTVVVIRLVRSH